MMLNYLNQIVAVEEMPIDLEWLLFANGSPSPHNNLFFFGFSSGQDTPIYVAKRCRSSIHNRTIRNEYERLRDLWRVFGTDAIKLAPEPLALAEQGKDLTLMMSFCDGKTLLSRLFSPWKENEQMLQLWRQAAVLLRTVHRQTAVSPPPASSQFNFALMVDTFIELFSPTATETKELASLIESVAQSQTNTAVLLHGDFWPGNIIIRSDNAALMLIDWQFSRWSCDASLDLYLFPLVCAIQATPNSPPATQSVAAADMLMAWQANLLPSYLQTYGTAAGCGLLSLRAGLLAVCVEMAVRPSFTFGIQQEDSLLWRALFTELSERL